MLSFRSLIKHYTPPTCTLEIYAQTSLFARRKKDSIPEEFNFELHFDDPRLPEENKVTIKGDRSQLELLSQVVNDYIHSFLQTAASNFPFPSFKAESKAEKAPIYFVNEGLVNQELHYRSGDENNFKTVIKLTASQLFDLANTLENYSVDIQYSPREKITSPQTLTFASTVAIFLVCVGLGAIWWRDRLFVAQDNPNSSTEMIALEQKVTKVDDLIPPTPVNPSTIPNVPFPQLPANLQNLTKLPPPTPITQPVNAQRQNHDSNNQLLPPPTPITQPANAQRQNHDSNNQLLPPPPAPRDINTAVTPDILPPPSPPSPISVPSPPTSTTPNLIAIQPNPNPSSSSTVNSSFVAEQSTLENLLFSELPNLQGSPSSTQLTKIDSGFSNSFTAVSSNLNTLPTPLNTSSSQQQTNKSQKITTPAEIKAYFQPRWQPPKNLTQSIEYRLLVNNQGAIERIIPMGQASRTFLDRTGMPLLGEAIVSALPEQEKATIRLILSPSGNVETFLEYSIE